MAATQDTVRTAVALIAREVLMPDVPRADVLGDELPDDVLYVMEALTGALLMTGFKGREQRILATMGEFVAQDVSA